MMSLLEAIKRHRVLNPRLWDGDKLKPDVREALLHFGRAWQRYAKIPDGAVEDVRFVGGNASYWYSEDSDIDVHVLIDKESLGFGPIMDDFLDDRKTLWTLKHHVTVRGYTLEPYAQDVNDFVPGDEAVYSVVDDKWVQRPELTRYDPIKDADLARKTTTWQRVIERACEGHDVQQMRGLKERLKAMRGEGLHKEGELSQKNMIFKGLRGSGHLERLTKHMRAVEDSGLSL